MKREDSSVAPIDRRKATLVITKVLTIVSFWFFLMKFVNNPQLTAAKTA